MFSKSVFITFVTLSIHAFLAQAAPFGTSDSHVVPPYGSSGSSLLVSRENVDEDCDVPHTITVTVTPTASISSTIAFVSTVPTTISSSRGSSSSNSGSTDGNSSSDDTSSGKSDTKGNTGSSTSGNSGSGNVTTSSGSNGSSSKGTSGNSASTNTSSSGTTSGIGNTSGSTSSTGSTGDSTSNNGSSSDSDLQSSLTLDPSLLATGFEQDGQSTQEVGQVASLTSKNNFINFCATFNGALTNGQQVKNGSCNAAPMGIIASVNNMPTSKFISPKNLDTIKANTSFTVRMAISNLETGNFVNPNTNYFAAPQQVNGEGNIIGHSHIVIQEIPSLTSTQPQNPSEFAFFLGLNSAANNGVLEANVTNGLPEGTYRIASINSAANHQPVLVAVAQHAPLDDMVYFSVTADGESQTA